MNKCKGYLKMLFLALLLGTFVTGGASAEIICYDTQAPTNPVAVSLGAAAPFGVFGGAAGMTNQGTSTVINGYIGTTAASTLITGFHDTGGNVYTETPLNIGTVNGTVYTATAPPGSVPGVTAAAQTFGCR